MADNAEMSIQPAEVLDVSHQLDLLASRMQGILRDEAANLNVTASARDEVSQRIASTVNEVHTLFGAAADQGLGGMHEVAATLRAHSSNVVAADEELGS